MQTWLPYDWLYGCPSHGCHVHPQGQLDEFGEQVGMLGGLMDEHVESQSARLKDCRKDLSDSKQIKEKVAKHVKREQTKQEKVCSLDF